MLPFIISARLGYTLNLLILPIASFLTIAPKFIYNYKLIPFETSEVHSIEEMKKCFYRFYCHPDQYLCLFVLGIIVGYAMRNRQPFDAVLKKRRIRVTVAILCYSSSLLGIIWSENFKDMNEPQNKLNLNVWFTFNKLFWMIGNIWIIYDFHSRHRGIQLNNYGNIINLKNVQFPRYN